jgi:hypothetical protein
VKFQAVVSASRFGTDYRSGDGIFGLIICKSRHSKHVLVEWVGVKKPDDFLVERGWSELGPNRRVRHTAKFGRG